jgi:prepilin-type N-terminal cleavage/methylation domain-containing protein
MKSNLNTNRTGFTLVESTIVVVILGLLATFAVPRFMTSVEKTKASEAFAYLSQVEGAQARYNAEHGRYATRISKLDLDIDGPEFFNVPNIVSSDWETRWELTLTRNSTSSGYGRYTVTFDQGGYNKARSTISRDLAPAL